MRRVVALLFALWVLWTPFAALGQEWASGDDPVLVVDTPPDLPTGWQQVSGPFLEVYGVPDSLPVLLEIARQGSDSLPRLAQAMGLPIGSTVHVVVAPTQRDFFELQPGRVPEWADGTAYPDRGLVFLRRPGLRAATDRPLSVVFDHELVHVLLGRAFAPQVPPRWLTEGLAQVLAGEHDPEQTRRLARGMVTSGLLTLEELHAGFPEDPQRAGLAYAQSADLVSWMQAEYGEESVRALIGEMAAGAPVERAVRVATGELLEEVDRKWRATLTSGAVPFWISAAGADDLLWGSAAAVAVVGLVLARRRIRRRMEAMAERERVRDALLAALWRPGDRAG